ncbi:MAG: DUF86 domain-containing protein [Thermodesulfobacteriota bacterium]|nr:MAG: DUF86 domain-containing protein [Thermodesulfobacteriota bacterium]
MFLSPHECIHHILDEIDYILTQISGMDYGSFVRNPSLKRAFVRSLEIIGEASKKLPEDVKRMQSDIEWRKLTGMRDRLIHDYFGVDYTIVWDVATTKLPDLRAKLQTLLEATGKCQHDS